MLWNPQPIGTPGILVDRVSRSAAAHGMPA